MDKIHTENITVPGLLRFSLSLIFILFSWLAYGQRLIAERVLEQNGNLLPDDLPNVIPVGNNAFVMLESSGGGAIKLSLFDDGLEGLWQMPVRLDSSENLSRMFVRGDTVVLCSFTIDERASQAILSFRYYSLLAGIPLGTDDWFFPFSPTKIYRPRISFSKNHSKFMVYGYVRNGEKDIAFDIFRFGEDEPFARHKLPPESFPAGTSESIYLDDDGSLFVVIADVLHEELTAFFARGKQQGWTKIESEIFADKLMERTGNMHIVRQGASTFFIAVPTMIGYELTGIFAIGVNVVFKNILYAHHYDLLGDDVKKMYENSYDLRDEVSGDETLTLALKHFYLVQIISNDEKAVTLIFEHSTEGSGMKEARGELSGKIENDNDDAGDLLLFGFSPGGEMEWSTVLRKNQHNVPTGLSFLAMKNDRFLRIAFQSHSSEHKMRVAEIDAGTGWLVAEAQFLPDRPFIFVKKYSCWFDARTMLIGGNTLSDPPKRMFMVVEF